MHHSTFKVTQDVKTLVEKIREEKCILFLGAGVHSAPPERSPYTYPEQERPLLGHRLAEKLAEECGSNSEFLFSVGLEFQKELEDWKPCNDLSDAFRKKFEDHKISLCGKDNVSVKTVGKGTKWQIIDTGQGQTYTVIKAEEALNIHKSEFPEASSRDLQRISLWLEIMEGRDRLVDCLDTYLMEGKKPSPALEMLARLPFRIIVTTNYDRLLENELIRIGKRPAIRVYNPRHHEPTPDSFKDPTAERPLVFKMHGDLDDRPSIVITDEDYIKFVQRMSEKDSWHPVPETVRFRIKKWPTLFVGYSLRDYNLRLLFRTLRGKLDGADFPQSYSVDLKPDRLIKILWQDRRGFVTFVAEDAWAFVPWLYKVIQREDYPA